MMKLAFFIAEIADARTEALLRGAVKRAKEKKISLLICPGRYLVSAGHRETGLPDYYQETAVFDYITNENADGLIIDVAEITKHASGRKKEDFIRKYAYLPQILIDKKQSGNTKSASLNNPRVTSSFLSEENLAEAQGAHYARAITTSEEDDYESIGKEAVDMLAEQVECIRKTFGNTSAKETKKPSAKVKTKKAVAEKQTDDRLRTTNAILEEAAHTFFHHKYQPQVNPYDMILKRAASFGASFGALYLFPEAVIYTQDNTWEKPEQMLTLSLMQDNENVKLKEAIPVAMEDVISNAAGDDEEAYICILNNLYLQDRQIGLLLTEFTPAFNEKYINALFLYMVTGAVRLIANDQQLVRTQDALNENKKVIEKDASVLERLGGEDYLTKKLNRRGFFSHAYDKLAKKFVEGTYAVVAYIDMDSIKSINAYFGREEGDNAVRRVADLLEQIFGKDCVLGRIRGNEFAVLLVTRKKSLSEELKDEMAQQNLRLMKDTSKPYIIHLQFSICSFKYREGLSLKDMLSETDDNLQKVRQI